MYSGCTQGTLFSERVHVSPPSFHAVFRSRTVDNDRNCRIAVPRWRYGKLLYVSTYTYDRSSILFDSCFFVSRHIIQFSFKRCENDKATKAISYTDGHRSKSDQWKQSRPWTRGLQITFLKMSKAGLRQALLIVFLVSKMVGNFSQNFQTSPGALYSYVVRLRFTY